jgi:hypothetical protein
MLQKLRRSGYEPDPWSRWQEYFDLRLIGEFKILKKNGEWRLRAEARAPTAP